MTNDAFMAVARPRLSVAVRLICAVAVVLAVAGCDRGDFEMVITNGSPREWMVRVQQAPDSVLLVRRVAPGASGWVLFWEGPIDTPVDVLEDDCSVVGTFRQDSNGTWVVEGIEGLTAVVQPYWTTAFPDRPSDGIELTAECGGFIRI